MGRILLSLRCSLTLLYRPIPFSSEFPAIKPTASHAALICTGSRVDYDAWASYAANRLGAGRLKYELLPPVTLVTEADRDALLLEFATRPP